MYIGASHGLRTQAPHTPHAATERLFIKPYRESEHSVIPLDAVPQHARLFHQLSSINSVRKELCEPSLPSSLPPFSVTEMAGASSHCKSLLQEWVCQHCGDSLPSGAKSSVDGITKANMSRGPGAELTSSAAETEQHEKLSKGILIFVRRRQQQLDSHVTGLDTVDRSYPSQSATPHQPALPLCEC